MTSETQPTAVFRAQSHAVKQCVNIMNEDWEYTFFFFFSPVSPHLKLKFVVMRICAEIIQKNTIRADKLSLLRHEHGTAERQASSASGCINRWLLMLSERQFNIIACGLYLAFN